MNRALQQLKQLWHYLKEKLIFPINCMLSLYTFCSHVHCGSSKSTFLTCDFLLIFARCLFTFSREQDYSENQNSLGIRVNDKHSDAISSHVALDCLAPLSRGVQVLFFFQTDISHLYPPQTYCHPTLSEWQIFKLVQCCFLK